MNNNKKGQGPRYGSQPKSRQHLNPHHGGSGRENNIFHDSKVQERTKDDQQSPSSQHQQQYYQGQKQPHYQYKKHQQQTQQQAQAQKQAQVQEGVKVVTGGNKEVPRKKSPSHPSPTYASVVNANRGKNNSTNGETDNINHNINTRIRESKAGHHSQSSTSTTPTPSYSSTSPSASRGFTISGIHFGGNTREIYPTKEAEIKKDTFSNEGLSSTNSISDANANINTPFSAIKGSTRSNGNNSNMNTASLESNNNNNSTDNNNNNKEAHLLASSHNPSSSLSASASGSKYTSKSVPAPVSTSTTSTSIPPNTTYKNVAQMNIDGGKGTKKDDLELNMNKNASTTNMIPNQSRPNPMANEHPQSNPMEKTTPPTFDNPGNPNPNNEKHSHSRSVGKGQGQCHPNQNKPRYDTGNKNRGTARWQNSNKDGMGKRPNIPPNVNNNNKMKYNYPYNGHGSHNFPHRYYYRHAQQHQMFYNTQQQNTYSVNNPSTARGGGGGDFNSYQQQQQYQQQQPQYDSNKKFPPWQNGMFFGPSLNFPMQKHQRQQPAYFTKQFDNISLMQDQHEQKLDCSSSSQTQETDGYNRQLVCNEVTNEDEVTYEKSNNTNPNPIDYENTTSITRDGYTSNDNNYNNNTNEFSNHSTATFNNSEDCHHYQQQQPKNEVLSQGPTNDQINWYGTQSNSRQSQNYGRSHYPMGQGQGQGYYATNLHDENNLPGYERSPQEKAMTESYSRMNRMDMKAHDRIRPNSHANPHVYQNPSTYNQQQIQQQFHYAQQMPYSYPYMPSYGQPLQNPKMNNAFNNNNLPVNKLAHNSSGTTGSIDTGTGTGSQASSSHDHANDIYSEVYVNSSKTNENDNDINRNAVVSSEGQGLSNQLPPHYRFNQFNENLPAYVDPYQMYLHNHPFWQQMQQQADFMPTYFQQEPGQPNIIFDEHGQMINTDAIPYSQQPHYPNLQPHHPKSKSQNYPTNKASNEMLYPFYGDTNSSVVSNTSTMTQQGFGDGRDAETESILYDRRRYEENKRMYENAIPSMSSMSMNERFQHRQGEIPANINLNGEVQSNVENEIFNENENFVPLQLDTSGNHNRVKSTSCNPHDQINTEGAYPDSHSSQNRNQNQFPGRNQRNSKNNNNKDPKQTGEQIKTRDSLRNYKNAIQSAYEKRERRLMIEKKKHQDQMHNQMQEMQRMQQQIYHQAQMYQSQMQMPHFQPMQMMQEMQGQPQQIYPSYSQPTLSQNQMQGQQNYQHLQGESNINQDANNNNNFQEGVSSQQFQQYNYSTSTPDEFSENAAVDTPPFSQQQQEIVSLPEDKEQQRQENKSEVITPIRTPTLISTQSSIPTPPPTNDSPCSQKPPSVSEMSSTTTTLPGTNGSRVESDEQSLQTSQTVADQKQAKTGTIPFDGDNGDPKTKVVAPMNHPGDNTRSISSGSSSKGGNSQESNEVRVSASTEKKADKINKQGVKNKGKRSPHHAALHTSPDPEAKEKENINQGGKRREESKDKINTSVSSATEETKPNMSNKNNVCLRDKSRKVTKEIYSKEMPLSLQGQKKEEEENRERESDSVGRVLKTTSSTPTASTPLYSESTSKPATLTTLTTSQWGNGKNPLKFNRVLKKDQTANAAKNEEESKEKKKLYHYNINKNKKAINGKGEEERERGNADVDIVKNELQSDISISTSASTSGDRIINNTSNKDNLNLAAETPAPYTDTRDPGNMIALTREPEDVEGCELFIVYLPFSVTTKEVFHIFNNYEEIQKIQETLDEEVVNTCIERKINQLRELPHPYEQLGFDYELNRFDKHRASSENNDYIPRVDDVVSSSIPSSVESYFKVRSARVARHRDTQLSRGFAFVTFFDQEHARKAQKVFDGIQILSKYIKVKENSLEDRYQSFRDNRRNTRYTPRNDYSSSHRRDGSGYSGHTSRGYQRGTYSEKSFRHSGGRAFGRGSGEDWAPYSKYTHEYSQNPRASEESQAEAMNIKEITSKSNSTSPSTSTSPIASTATAKDQALDNTEKETGSGSHYQRNSSWNQFEYKQQKSPSSHWNSNNQKEESYTNRSKDRGGRYLNQGFNSERYYHGRGYSRGRHSRTSSSSHNPFGPFHNPFGGVEEGNEGCMNVDEDSSPPKLNRQGCHHNVEQPHSLSDTGMNERLDHGPTKNVRGKSSPEAQITHDRGSEKSTNLVQKFLSKNQNRYALLDIDESIDSYGKDSVQEQADQSTRNSDLETEGQEKSKQHGGYILSNGPKGSNEIAKATQIHAKTDNLNSSSKMEKSPANEATEKTEFEIGSDPPNTVRDKGKKEQEKLPMNE